MDPDWAHNPERGGIVTHSRYYTKIKYGCSSVGRTPGLGPGGFGGSSPLTRTILNVPVVKLVDTCDLSSHNLTVVKIRILPGIQLWIKIK